MLHFLWAMLLGDDRGLGWWHKTDSHLHATCHSSIHRLRPALTNLNLTTKKVRRKGHKSVFLVLFKTFISKTIKNDHIFLFALKVFLYSHSGKSREPPEPASYTEIFKIWMVQKHVHTGIIQGDLCPHICLFSPPLSSVYCHVQDILSLTVNLPFPPYVFNRSGVFLDLQWVPDLREAGHPPLYLAGDGEPVHRQSGALRRGKLHLRGDQHGHQDPRSGSPHATGAP